MPYSAGIFTRLKNWVTESLSPPIAIADLDLQEEDFATAFNNCLLRDGTGVPTADTPWNNKKITGLATPTASTDASTKGYVDTITTGLLTSVTASHSSNFTVGASDVGKFVLVLTPTTVVSLPAGLGTNLSITLINDNTASITLQATGGGGLYWLPATGTRVGPASRTIANASVITCFTQDGSNWAIWGQGIS